MKISIDRLSSKISYYLILLFSFCLLYSSSYAQKSYGNINPSSIKDLKYDWSEAEAEDEYKKRTPVEDQWFSQYTKLKPGYIRKMDGTFESGEIQIRWRYNQASKEKIKNSEGRKVPHPKGWKGTHEIYLTVDGEKTTYKPNELKQYGHHYTKDEWVIGESNNPLERFNQATIYFKNEEVLEGLVRLSANKGLFEMNEYRNVYYNYGEDAHVYPYPADEVAAAEIETSGGSVYLHNFKTDLIEAPKFYQELSSNYKDHKLDPGIKAVMLDENLKKVNGEVFFDKGKKKKEAYFFTADHNQLYFLNQHPFSALVASMDGGEKHINFFEGKYLSMEEIKEDLNKKDLLLKGEVVLESGESVKGEVFFLRMANVVKSYRFIYGVSIIPEGKRYFQPFQNDNIDYVKVTEEGKEVNYIQVGDYYENQENFVEQLKINKSPDPFQSLRDGYIMLEGNKKVSGKIASSPPSTIYFLGEDGIPVRYKAKSDQLKYYVQSLDGKDYKFVGLLKRSSQLNNPHVFVKIEEPWGKYSFYKNPYPTHLRKGMTKFGAGAINYAGQEVQEELAYHGAKQAARDEMEQSGSITNAAIAAERTYTDIASTQIIRVDDDAEGGIFFEEYVVFENQGDAVYNIYKKNDEAELRKLLSTCPAFEGMGEKEQEQLLRVEAVSKTVQFLNKCE